MSINKAMSFLRDGVAVVTGAGSGIGRGLARQLAVAGSALALADIDEAGLQQTAASLMERGVKLTTHIVDVSDESAMQDLRKRCRAAWPGHAADQ